MNALMSTFNEKNLDINKLNFQFKPHNAVSDTLYNSVELNRIIELVRTNPNISLDELKSNPIAWTGLNIQDKTIAVVGSRYQFIDHTKLISAVESASQSAGIDIKPLAQRNDKSMQLHEFQWIFPEPLKIANEDYYLSLGVRDSYGGRISCEGHLYLFRKVCSNGLHIAKTTEHQFRIRHQGDFSELSVFMNVDAMISNMSKHFVKIEKLRDNSVKIDASLLQNLDKLYGGRVAENAMEVYNSLYSNTLGRNEYALMQSFTYASSHLINSYSGRNKAEDTTERVFIEIGFAEQMKFLSENQN